MVRQWWKPWWSCTSESVFWYFSPDFQLMAQAYGVKSINLTIQRLLLRIWSAEGRYTNVFIEVTFSRKEHVLGQWYQAGKSNHEMLGWGSMRRMLTAKPQNRSRSAAHRMFLSRRQQYLRVISCSFRVSDLYPFFVAPPYHHSSIYHWQK